MELNNHPLSTHTRGYMCYYVIDGSDFVHTLYGFCTSFMWASFNASEAQSIFRTNGPQFTFFLFSAQSFLCCDDYKIQYKLFIHIYIGKVNNEDKKYNHLNFLDFLVNPKPSWYYPYNLEK